jgi:hypothetical protein
VEEKVKFIDLLFGCTHKRTSFPISSKPGQRRSAAACQTGTYVVCLDCGKEFAYDWQQMRVISSNKEQSAVSAQPVATSN